MDSNVEKFKDNPQEGMRYASQFRREDWKTLADYYGISYTVGARKAALRSAVVSHLGINEGVQEREEEQGEE